MLHARGPARGKKDEKRRGEADPYNDGAECFSSCGGLAERNKNKIEKERGDEKRGGERRMVDEEEQKEISMPSHSRHYNVSLCSARWLIIPSSCATFSFLAASCAR